MPSFSDINYKAHREQIIYNQLKELYRLSRLVKRPFKLPIVNPKDYAERDYTRI